jgi:alkylated DNA repair protein alkB family protein 1
LSTHYALPPDLFELYSTSPSTPISTLYASLTDEEKAAIRAKEAEIGHRTTRESKSGVEMGYNQILESGRAWEGDTPGSRLGEKTAGDLMKELRWANLGWVYRVSLLSFSYECSAKAT